MGRARELFERLRDNGVAEIQRLIRDRAAESLFLDFKRAENNGDSESMPDQVRNSLSEAVAGFGNSEGGVIVWGVDCSKRKDGADVPTEGQQPGIVNVRRFVSWLNGAVSGTTLPPHVGVENLALPLGETSDDGFVVTFVEKGLLVPYRQLHGKETNARYPIRAGSSFVAATHDALAGMFGRRPQPKLLLKLLLGPIGDGLNKALSFELGFLLQNKGPVLARDVYFNANVLSLPGPQCRIEYAATDSPFQKVNVALGMFFSTVSNPGERFAPESFTMPTTLRFHLSPPFTKALKAVFVWGCEGASVNKSTWVQEADELQRHFDELKALERDPSGYMSDAWTDKVRRLLAIPDPHPL